MRNCHQANNRNGPAIRGHFGDDLDADELGDRIAANLREQQNDFVVHPEQFQVFVFCDREWLTEGVHAEVSDECACRTPDREQPSWTLGKKR